MSALEHAVPLDSIPLACNLSENTLYESKAAMMETLYAHVTEKIALEDGYEFQFSAEFPLQPLCDFIQNERACCTFFTFELVITPAATALRLRGAEGVKEFIEQTLLA